MASDRGSSRRRAEDEANGKNGGSSPADYQRLRQRQQWETSGTPRVPPKRSGK